MSDACLTCVLYVTVFSLGLRELKYGIPVTDENGNRLGDSVNAARQAIVQVVVSRIGMAMPAMGNVRIMSLICGSIAEKF